MGMRGDKKIQDMIDYDIKGPNINKHKTKTISKTWKVDWDSKLANLFKKIFRR